MTVRTIPPSLAPVLTELELERPAVVTVEWLDRAADRLGLKIPGRILATRLRELGWLLSLRVRGAWEFAPGDRAGPLPGGDPFIELRAIHVLRPNLRFGVGYESAAFLRGLATRQPDREVIVVPEGAPRIQALREYRRIELTLPEIAIVRWRAYRSRRRLEFSPRYQLSRVDSLIGLDFPNGSMLPSLELSPVD